MVKLSIIIPTLNEGRYLSILLDSIKMQTYKNYEIVVSDGSSEDNTVEVAKRYQCRIVVDKRKGPGYGRNQGARIASGHYLLFLDADVFLPSDTFLEDLMSIAERKRVRLGTCLVEPYPPRPVDVVVNPIVNAGILAAARVSPFAPGFFIFVSREIHEKIKGFNEKLFLAEDHDYARRATKYAPFKVIAGLKVYYSTRRLDKEGRLSIYPKYVLATLYRALLGEIDKPVFNYDFGNFEPPKENYNEILRKISRKKYVDGAIVRKILKRLKETRAAMNGITELTKKTLGRNKK